MRKAARKAREAALNHGMNPSRVRRDESEYNKDSCQMRHVFECDFFNGDSKPRDTRGWFFWKDIVRTIDGVEHRCRGIFARYPDGSAAHLPVRPVPEQMKDLNGGHSWAWNGDLNRPTLTPSVHIVGSWHGWIRDGHMQSC